MFLEALESAAELQSLSECVAVVLRTNRTATRRSTRLWRSSRRSRSFLAPAPFLLPLHPNPAPCLQEHPGARPHPHPHPQVSHRLLSTLWGLSYNLCCLHFFSSSLLAEICSICGIAPVHAQCFTCVQRLCLKCDMLYHSHPERKGHQRNVTTPAKASRSAQEHREEPARAWSCLFFSCLCSSSPSLSPWECSHCTTVNEMRAVLCATCERPRLAMAASLLQDSLSSLPSSPSTGESGAIGAT